MAGKAYLQLRLGLDVVEQRFAKTDILPQRQSDD